MSSMFEQLLQSSDAVSLQPRRPAAVQESVSPDYAALIDVLTRLYHIRDGLGETVLSPEESAAIRRCGFATFTEADERSADANRHAQTAADDAAALQVGFR